MTYSIGYFDGDDRWHEAERVECRPSRINSAMNRIGRELGDDDVYARPIVAGRMGHTTVCGCNNCQEVSMTIYICQLCNCEGTGFYDLHQTCPQSLGGMGGIIWDCSKCNSHCDPSPSPKALAIAASRRSA